ncbi:recombinase family protein [bacterium]|nr:recombinase family protein [bacterium]
MKKKIRCAIYTRKSTEEGLEQDFNSLDAQREACEAYIKSQMHEGWVLLDKQYNDGGYSGGTMERPSFKELLKDIENDEVDIVVVYKVDRLTRSLMDFSKIIDVFDKHNASFVSITQHFNTTTSMGRLTLNILLSFAQFEREVTGERIRDKFEASRKKGLWLSGTAPYGYIKDDHHMLHLDPPYSDNVQIIFESYLKIKNVLKLKKYLAEQKIRTRSGKELAKGSLYHILSNKVYLGKIVHKNKEYDGLHVPIISEELFNDVQNLLKANSVERKHAINAKNGSLLAGLIYDDIGNKMSPSASNANNKHYRYYVSMAVKNPIDYERGEITKISAGEIEKFVQNDLVKLLQNTYRMQSYLENYPVEQQKIILEKMQSFETDKVFLRTAIKRVDLKTDNISISYDINYIIKYFATLAFNAEFNHTEEDELIIINNIQVRISLTPQRQNKIIIPGKANYDMKLIQAIVKSFWYNKLGAERKLPIEARNGNNKRLRKLRFLPPEIIESIMNGTQDPELNVKQLIAMAEKYC